MAQESRIVLRLHSLLSYASSVPVIAALVSPTVPILFATAVHSLETISLGKKPTFTTCPSALEPNEEVDLNTHHSTHSLLPHLTIRMRRRSRVECSAKSRRSKGVFLPTSYDCEAHAEPSGEGGLAERSMAMFIVRCAQISACASTSAWIHSTIARLAHTRIHAAEKPSGKAARPTDGDLATAPATNAVVLLWSSEGPRSRHSHQIGTRSLCNCAVA